MEDNLKMLIESALDVPCYMAGDSSTYPSATVEITDDYSGIYGDGAAKNREHNARIDLWYLERAERDTAANILLEALNTSEIDMTAPDITLTFDIVARKWRATFHFTIY